MSLDGRHDRQIGMRLTGDGSNIQLWATDGAEPETHEPTPDLPPMPRGQRWHTWVHIGSLETDRDPATVLYTAISDRLMPAFDTKPLYVGHRPCDPAPELETDAQADTQATAPAADPTDQPPPSRSPRPTSPRPSRRPAPAAEPAAKVIPMRTRRPKADTPVTAGAEPKPRTPKPATS